MKGRRQVERLVARGRLAVSSNQPDRPLETTFMDAPPAPDERGWSRLWDRLWEQVQVRSPKRLDESDGRGVDGRSSQVCAAEVA
jgi:hypothetical protein